MILKVKEKAQESIKSNAEEENTGVNIITYLYPLVESCR